MMISVDDVLREAAGSLDYAADALEAPVRSHMRETTRDLKAARATVAAMLAALETIVAMECWGASAEAMRLRLIVSALIKQTKGEE
jgi:hypothetical protein